MHRPPGTRTLPKDVWRRRIQLFQDGEWQQLLETTATTSTDQPAPNARPNSNPSPPSSQRRAERARHLVHLGELSAARQALTATPPAPGTETTLAQLRDPTRRPVEPYTPIPTHLAEFAPEQHLQIPAQRLLTALRRSRKGAAPGPSGLTADTLRLVLDDETTTTQFVTVCNLLAQARIPATIAKAIGMGRMVALQKPNGGVRGLVIGDVLRRVVSRCLVHMFATKHPRSLQSTPICLVHPCRDRGDHPCPQHSDATQHRHHSPIHRWGRCIRHHIQNQHVAGTFQHPSSQPVPTLRALVVCHGVGIRLAR